MPYKTITLELLRDRFPALHLRLRRQRRLLQALDSYARELRDFHRAHQDAIARTNPEASPHQIASEALELATRDLEARFSADSSADIPA